MWCLSRRCLIQSVCSGMCVARRCSVQQKARWANANAGPTLRKINWDFDDSYKNVADSESNQPHFIVKLLLASCA